MFNHVISEYSKLAGRKYKTRHKCIRKTDPRGILHEIKIWLFYQMVYAQTKICNGEWDAQNSLWIWNKTDHLIPARRPDPAIVNKDEKKEPAK